MKLCAPATKVKKVKYEGEESDEVLNQAKAMAMIHHKSPSGKEPKAHKR